MGWLMPEVSVIIPTYNRADTLVRAVSSALAQTHTDIDVIVVDDGSQDDTAAILAPLADPRLRLVRHATNRGAGAARNTGLAASQSAFVAWLDSDDAWHPNKLATQLAALRAASPDEAVSCHAVMLHLLDHGIDRPRRPRQQQDWRQALLLDCDLSPGCTLLARREAFDRVGPIDESLPRFEDWDWLLRYVMTGGRILLLPDILAEVWNRRGRLGEQHEQSARQFMAKHHALYAAMGAPLRRQAFCDIWLQVSGTYAFQGKPYDALRTALLGTCQRPVHTASRIMRFGLSQVTARAGLRSGVIDT